MLTFPCPTTSSSQKQKQARDAQEWQVSAEMHSASYLARICTNSLDSHILVFAGVNMNTPIIHWGDQQAGVALGSQSFLPAALGPAACG